MKKYTLKVKALDDSVTGINLRTAIESVLLHLHPRITYRLGLISNIGSNSFLAEIASDCKKDLLETSLKAIQGKIPVIVEQLGWGWIVKNVTELSNDHASQQFPLATIQPEANARSFLPNTITFLFRYGLLISLTFALIGLIIAKIYVDDSLWLDSAYFVVFMAWIFLTDIPLDIRLYVQQIDCELTELVVIYRFGKKTVRMNWQTIQGLQYKNMIYAIYRSDHKPVRFLVDSGFKEKHALLATIIQRASLNDVEAGVSMAVYRRYEAP